MGSHVSVEWASVEYALYGMRSLYNVVSMDWSLWGNVFLGNGVSVEEDFCVWGLYETETLVDRISMEWGPC